MTIPFDVEINGRELVASGVMISHEGEEIVFKIADLKFSVHFENTEDKKLTVRLEEGASEKSAKIRLINFTNPLGTHWYSSIGFINDRDLRVDMFVHTLGDEGRLRRLLNYTFSLGEKNNG